VGMPPELNQGMDNRVEMPEAEVLILRQDEDGASLDRYTADGEFVGDTWHPSEEEAVCQAAHEYGSALGQWEPIPSRCDDPIAFAIEAARKRRA
jgi:hypothetical protein